MVLETLEPTTAIVDMESLDVMVMEEEIFLTNDIYREIRQRLALRGVPPEQVAFIHDAKNSRQRAQLFKAVNAGNIRVLIGSSEKMGTGMNAQERLTAIHQITPPWRPADIAQQVGRMHRQGNSYPEVFQLVYITEGSFDGYMWQSLETKLSFIEQVDADYGIHLLDDISEGVLTFSEIKALASGNPKIIQKVTLDAELMRLSAVRASWKSGRRKAEMQRGRLDYVEAALRKDIAGLEETIQVRDENTLERFTILLKKSAYAADGEMMIAFKARAAAGKHLRSLVHAAAIKLWSEQLDTLDLGVYKGMRIEALLDKRTADPLALAFFQAGDKKYQIMIGESDQGITMSLDARFRALDNVLVDEREQLESTLQKQAALDEELTRPWEHQGRITELIEETTKLDAELNADDAAGIDLESSLSGQDPESAIAESQARLQEALETLQALHVDPDVLARFDIEAETDDADETTAPVPAVQTLITEIESRQAELSQLQFALSVAEALPDATVQLDMFGGHTRPQKKRRRRRRPVTPTQAQLALLMG